MMVSVATAPRILELCKHALCRCIARSPPWFGNRALPLGRASSCAPTQVDRDDYQSSRSVNQASRSAVQDRRRHESYWHDPEYGRGDYRDDRERRSDRRRRRD